MNLPRFDLFEPRTIGEALELLASGGRRAAPLAGGTDLLVNMKKTCSGPEILVSLHRVPGLDLIAEKDGFVTIGPLVTMASLLGDPVVAARLPVLVDGAGSVAAPLIRNRATVGGNLCNARPCADTAPPLMALDARVVLATSQNEREAPLDTMIKGPGETIIRPTELLTAIKVPRPQGYSSGSYRTAIRRQTMDITVTGVAAQVTLDRPGGTVTAARIFAASVAPVPLRLPETERTVIGQSLTTAVLARAEECAANEVRPIDDLRGEAWYRRHVSGVLARQTLAEAGTRAGEVQP